MRLSDERFGELVQEALDSIPPEFDPYMDNVVVDIEDAPTRKVLQTVGLNHPHELLGYYAGIPLTARSVEHIVRLPDHIIIYKRNIERICRSEDEIVEQVRKTVLHEVGHHFGMDEEALEDLDY